MVDKEGPKRRPGRPRKYPVDGKRQNLTFRLSEDTRRRLLEASLGRGRSLSEEIDASKFLPLKNFTSNALKKSPSTVISFSSL